MDNIRILHLVPEDDGGIHRFVFGNYKYMNQTKIHFDFLTKGRWLQTSENYKCFNYKVYLLRESYVSKSEFEKELKCILTNNYDVLHLHTSFWTGTMIENVAKDVGVPRVIVHSHSSYIEENDTRLREEKLKVHNYIKGTISTDLATDFWACSHKAADWLYGDIIPSEKIQIVKNSIDTKEYEFDPNVRVKARTYLGLDDKFVYGSVGRLSYQKNHEFMIDFFEKIHSSNKNTALLLVGDGELRSMLEDLAKSKGLQDSVIFVGWQSNINLYLNAMDCFLLSSRFEGFPIALLEAVSTGLPCIVSSTITDEVEFTNLVRRVDLNLDKWVSVSNSVRLASADRYCGKLEIEKGGHSIQNQAKELEWLYGV